MTWRGEIARLRFLHSTNVATSHKMHISPSGYVIIRNASAAC